MLQEFSELTRNPLTGKKAFEAWIYLTFRTGDTIWFKFGHNRFYKGKVLSNGNVEIWGTRGDGKNRRLTSEHYLDGYGFLSQLARNNDGGVFFIPGKPEENPLKIYCTASNDIGGEMDDGSNLEQWARVELVSQYSGLVFASIVGSGGKSIHPRLALTVSVPIAQWQYYQRMFAIALIGDPAVTNPHQPMRVPGFLRREKSKEQTLEFHSYEIYTPDELEAGFKRCFEKLGFKYYSQAEFSETRWSEIQSVQASKVLSRDEKEAKVREILALPEAELPANKRKREFEERRQQRQQNRATNLNGFDLVELVEQANQKLGADAFDWPGHNFKLSGNKARGGCPWHESSTGNAGWVALHNKKPGQYGYACPTCTDNHQVDGFTYWLYQKYGLNAPYPTGKQWVEDAKEFCAFAGIIIPEHIRNYQHENNSTTNTGTSRTSGNGTRDDKSTVPGVDEGGFTGNGSSSNDRRTANKYVEREPDTELYNEYVAREQYNEETDKLIAEEESKQGILDKLTKLRTKVKDFFKKIDKQPKAKSKTTPKIPILEYTPGNLPTPDKYSVWGYPKIVFKAEYRHQIWAEAIAKGHQFVLDNSHTGAGKSHSIGTFDYKAQIFYLAADHRNPTTKTIEENYFDLSVRNDGFRIDETRKTPNGNSFQVRTKQGEKADTPGNCVRTPIFNELRNKNIDLEGSDNYVCKTCSLSFLCKTSSGFGYGLRNQRLEALKKHLIRAHPDSMPKPDDYFYKNVIAFWDEPGQLLKTFKSISVNVAEFEKAMGMLESKSPEHFNALQPIRIALRGLYTGEIESERFGFDDKALRDLFPSNESFIENIKKFGFSGGGELIEELLTALEPELDFLNERENGLSKQKNDMPSESIKETKSPNEATYKQLDLFGSDKLEKLPLAEKKSKKEKQQDKEISKKTQKFINRELRRESRREMLEQTKNLLLDWLPQFLLILYYGVSGALTFDKKTLTIYSKNFRHLDLIEAVRTNIFVDATLSRKLLAQKLAPIWVDVDEILLIEEEKPNYSNLTIIQADGMGKLGKQRADSMVDERIPALKAELKAKHNDDIAFFDHKLFAEPEDGYHGRDNRGVNRFEDVSALASFGIPYPNIGALKAEFQLLSGYCPGEEDEKFDAFVNERVQGEIIQNVGRLRANRTDAPKTYYSIADYDISFLALAFPGATIKTQHVTDICTDAANSADRTSAAVLDAIKDVMSSGRKLTQQVVASAVGVTQSAVSKIISKLGGWVNLKKLFLLLLESFNSTRNNLKNLDEDARRIAQQWFPDLVDPPFSSPDPENVVTEVINTAKAYGTDKFVEILSATSFETKVGILACFIRILPDYVQQHFLDIATDAIFEPIEGF